MFYLFIYLFIYLFFVRFRAIYKIFGLIFWYYEATFSAAKCTALWDSGLNFSYEKCYFSCVEKIWTCFRFVRIGLCFAAPSFGFIKSL